MGAGLWGLLSGANLDFCIWPYRIISGDPFHLHISLTCPKEQAALRNSYIMRTVYHEAQPYPAAGVNNNPPYMWRFLGMRVFWGYLD